MAKKKGVCRNIDGGCSLAEGKVVQEVESTNFVCEECGLELYELKDDSKKKGAKKGSNRALIAIIAAVVVAAVAAAFFLLRDKAPRTVPVAAIMLNQEAIELPASEPFNLVATVLPEDATDKTVTWSVGDEEIVRSNGGGSFNCVKEGETVITASAGNAVATCKVTVTTPSMYSSIEKLTLDKNTLTLKVGAIEDLIARVDPVDAEDMTVTWASSDESVVTVENGKVKALKAGKATVTATSANPGIKDVCEVTVEAPKGPYQLGWGTYTGPMQGGKPHGLGGEVTVTKPYVLDLKKANGDTRSLNRGDKIVDCKFKDGKLVSGFIHYADGRQERINIGA